MKQSKLLIYLLPITAIAFISWVAFQQWQSSQSAARPDYDNLDPLPSNRLPPEPQNSKQAEVVDIQSGDTLTVTLDGRQESIRLCGIIAPKVGQPGGTESRDYLRSLIAAADNKAIVMTNDVDQQGRKVAEVFVPAPLPNTPDYEKFLNYELVNAGQAATHKVYVNNCLNGSLLVQSEEAAKQARRGMWSTSKKPI